MTFSAYWIVRFSPRIEKPATISNPKAIPLLTLFLVTTIQIARFKRKYGQRNLDNVHIVDWCLNVYASFFISTVNFENESRKSAIYIDETSLSTSNLNFSFIMFVKTQFVKRLFSKSQIGFEYNDILRLSEVFLF